MTIKEKQIDIFGKDPETIDELFSMVKSVISYNLVKQNEDAVLVGLGIDVTGDKQVSNSHSSPEGYKTNWGGTEPGEPRHYKGFSGRIWIRLSREASGWGSDVLRNTLTHSGSGGGGAYDGKWQGISTAYYNAPKRLQKAFIRPACVSYSYQFFLKDFPVIADAVNKKEMWDTLKNVGTLTNNAKTIIWWQDDVQLQKDRDFIKMLERTKERRVLGPNKSE